MKHCIKNDNINSIIFKVEAKESRFCWFSGVGKVKFFSVIFRYKKVDW